MDLHRDAEHQKPAYLQATHRGPESQRFAEKLSLFGAGWLEAAGMADAMFVYESERPSVIRRIVKHVVPAAKTPESSENSEVSLDGQC